MSISHYFPPEFRALVRAMDDPFARSGYLNDRGSFDSRLPRQISPAVDVSESVSVALTP